MRRHVGSSVRIRSYCNALEKCVKLPVGEEKCVIVVGRCSQGPFN
jgi:hypothetical protein